jgi:hypothetical protein
MAWARTAIAFAAVGAALLRGELIAGLIVLATAPLIWMLGHFVSRTSRSAVLSRRLLLVTVTVTVVSLLAALAALIGRSPASLDQLLPLHG